MLTTVCPPGSFLGLGGGADPLQLSSRRSVSGKLDPSNNPVAAIQGNAWLLALPAGLLSVCPAPPDARPPRACKDGPGTEHPLSTEATVPSLPPVLPTGRAGEAALFASQSKLGARTLRSAWHFLCWLWPMRPGQWAALLTPAQSNRHVPDSAAHRLLFCAPQGILFRKKRSPLPAWVPTELTSLAL